MAQIAVIGAGMAGLAAAQHLVRQGHQIMVYEKSRGVGGRVATRRVDGFRFDHGAQYVKAPTAELEALVRSVPGATDLRLPVWTFTSAEVVAPGDPAQNADPKWVWPTGLNELGKTLARGLTVRQLIQVERIVRDAARYNLYAADGNQLGPVDAVLLTPPPAQSAAIITASDIDPALQTTLTTELGQATYRRCITITLAYDQRPSVPWYALVNSDRSHPVSWLACEHTKPGYAPAHAGLIMLQMADGWSRTHWDALTKGTLMPGELPEAVHEAHQYAQKLTGGALGQPRWANLQRWRYALPDTGCAEATLNGTGSGIYFAGDFVAGQGRVHLAIENGWAVAKRMHTELMSGNRSAH